MDLKQLNVFLLPYNIEVSCEGCLGTTSSFTPSFQPFPAVPSFPNPPQNDSKMPKREDKKSPRKKMIQKVSRNQQVAVPSTGQYDYFGNSRQRTVSGQPTDSGVSLRQWQNVPPNPPNQFLNLNMIDAIHPKRPDLASIMEDSMKTPHKIGDVNIDHLMFSDKKRMSARKHQTGSTFDAGVFDMEDFPEQQPGTADGIHGTPLNHRMAFSGMNSKLASPCYTPVKFMMATPLSRVLKTPGSALSVSPIPRFSGNFDGLDKKNSDFPMNLFYDSL